MLGNRETRRQGWMVSMVKGDEMLSEVFKRGPPPFAQTRLRAQLRIFYRGIFPRIGRLRGSRGNLPDITEFLEIPPRRAVRSRISLSYRQPRMHLTCNTAAVPTRINE